MMTCETMEDREPRAENASRSVCAAAQRSDGETVGSADSQSARKAAVCQALAEASGGCPLACERTCPAARCANCIYAAHMRDGDQRVPICANTPNAPGEIVRIDPAGNCPNFRCRREPVVHGVPPQPADDSIRYIPLPHGLFAIVDAADYEWLSQYKWSVMAAGPYACRRDHGKTIYMHREIIQAPKGMCVDHIDGFPLDNRRTNLRTCTHAENMRNRRGNFGRALYKGVTCQRHCNKYRAGIAINGKPMHIGYYDDPVEAAKAYDRKALELFGEFARLNFPEEVERGSIDALRRGSGNEAEPSIARPPSLVPPKAARQQAMSDR